MIGKLVRVLKQMGETSFRFLLWSIREHMVKKILAWQTNNPQRAYQIWRRWQKAFGARAIAVREPDMPFASFVLLVDQENQHGDMERTLQSLIRQHSPQWEALVFVGDWVLHGTDTFNCCPDLRVQFCPISAGEMPQRYASAIAQAQGQFLCWLEVGGTLAPEALQEIRTVSAQSPDKAIFYFDEDTLSLHDKQFIRPLFKPGWSPELLLSTNYLRAGFFKKEFLMQNILSLQDPPGSAWDLALRCKDWGALALRVPRVLYHRPPGTKGLAEAERQDARQSLNRHLERMGFSNPEVTIDSAGCPQLRWQTRQHKVSIIIPTKENFVYLRKCIEAIRTHEYPFDYEIILIDTGSKAPEVAAYYRDLEKVPNIQIYFDDSPFNYNRINNIGAGHASGDLLLFLNNDIEAREPGWLEELVRWMEYPGVGVVGAKLIYPDDAVQHAGIIMGMEGHCSHVFGGAQGDPVTPFGSLDWYRNYCAVTGACLMTSRSVFDEVGRFDESYRLVFSDVEFCLRALRHGHRVMYTPFCKLIHYEGRSRGNSIPLADIQLGRDHFINLVRSGDPYYHPALSYSGKQPVFAWPFETSREKRLEIIARHAKFKQSQ